MWKVIGELLIKCIVLDKNYTTLLSFFNGSLYEIIYGWTVIRLLDVADQMNEHHLLIMSCVYLLSSVFVIFVFALLQNPYDSFMRKHLQHYGYYAGKLIRFIQFTVVECSYVKWTTAVLELHSLCYYILQKMSSSSFTAVPSPFWRRHGRMVYGSEGVVYGEGKWKWRGIHPANQQPGSLVQYCYFGVFG